MTGQQTFIARAVLGLVAGSATFGVLASPRLKNLTNTRFSQVVTGVFFFSRAGLFSILYFVLRLAPRGDIPAYYWSEANSVLRGLLPYRDFDSSYAPLHPYLDSLAIVVWRSPLAIIFLAILIETALLPLWLRFGRGLFPEHDLRAGALLYLTSAVSLQFVTVDGQDTVIVSVLLALALWFLSRQREFSSGVFVGTAIAAIKFLPVIYAPAFFLGMPRRWRWLSGFLVPIVAVYGVFAVMRLPVLMPLSQEGNLKSAGDLPFLIESVLNITLPSRIWDLLLAALFIAICVLVGRASLHAGLQQRIRIAAFATAALTLALLLFSKKSWPPYLMMSLFPICMLVDVRHRLQTLGFVFFSLVAITEHSYWSSFLHQLTATEFHKGLLSGQPTYFVFLALEILLVVGYGWLLARSLRQIGPSSVSFTDEVRGAPHLPAPGR